jgi:hypothetical protein
MDLNVFYTVVAGVAATLLGLLFVAVQQNLARLSMGPRTRWNALADSTFQTYALILAMALFTFIPIFRTPVLLGASALGIVRQVRTWVPIWQLTAQGRAERLRETFWLMVSPVIMYALVIYWASQLRQGKGDEWLETNLATAFVGLLLIVLRNSWRLLIQIASDEPRKEG